MSSASHGAGTTVGTAERRDLARHVGLLVGPTVLWMVVLFVLPVVYLFLLTFRPAAFGEHTGGLTLQNYRDFLANTGVQMLLLRSLWISLVVSVASVVLAFPLAHFLVFRAGKLQVPLLTVLMIPAWTSFLLRVLAWRVILGSSGLLNTFLIWVGLTDQMLPVLLYSPMAVVVTLVYVWIPFVAVPIVASLQRVESSLLESAADLGARPWQSFFSITLPLAVPGIVAAFLFVFIPTVGEYVTPALVGGTKGVMYGNIIWDQFSRALNWPQGALMSLVMLVVTLIPLVLLARVVPVSTIAGVPDA